VRSSAEVRARLEDTIRQRNSDKDHQEYWKRLAKTYEEKWLSKNCRWHGLEYLLNLILGWELPKKLGGGGE